MSEPVTNDCRHRHTIGDFARRVAIAALITIIMVGLTVLVGFSIDTWFTIYFGILLAIFIYTLSEWTCRYTHLPRKWAVPVVLLALIGLVILAAWLLAKPIGDEAVDLQQQVPKALHQLREQIHSGGLDRFVPHHLPSSSQIESATGKVASSAMTVFSVTARSVVTLLVVLFLGIYLAFSPETYAAGLVSLFPLSRRKRAREILSETGTKLRHWIFGQIVSMAAVGGMIAIGLYIAGIPLPLVIGFLAALLDIIPIFGPVIAGALAVLLGFTVNPWHGVYALIVFLIANQAEQHLLIPLVQRYSVSLPPALTISALLLMGSLFGFWGMLLAAPLTATVLVLVKAIYVRDILGDRSV
jgi:predicted PurR-regulated permease PerM